MSAGTGDVIFRALSRTFSAESRRRQEEEEWNDENSSDADSAKTKVELWRLDESVKQMQLDDRAESRSLGVTWKNLTVQVVPSDSMLQENVLSQFNIPQHIKEGRAKKPLKTILDSSSGCVKPGEMLLVLGRPGSGCTTLLKMLANKRKGYAQVDGDVRFGTLDAKEALKYRGYIAINTEEEVNFFLHV